VLGGTKNLTGYLESYGSKVDFALMCPNTTYWQEEMAQVVGTLAEGYNTDGVYIDQIACATPKPCFDPSHDHPLGGGSHWFWGYYHMLLHFREKSGPNKLLISESNSEPFMSGLDMILTLGGFDGGDLSPTERGATGTYLVPAFQSIYGGWVHFMGAEFFQQDFLPNPNVFAGKIANQMLFGAQMGWFSLGGRDNQVPPMGLFDLLMSEEYDSEVEYLQLLSTTRRTMTKWLVHGRAMRYVNLSVNGSSPLKHGKKFTSADHPRTSKGTKAALGLAFDPVLSTTWMDEQGENLLILIATVERYTPARVSSTLDITRYGFESESDDDEFDVFRMSNDGSKADVLLGTYSASAVGVDVALGVRDVVAIRVAKKE
jgi:hypothetical protein